MDRRRFLTTIGALGCSAAASPLVTPMAFASGPWDNRLVVIILRGAMDGIDVVAPAGEAAALAGLRPTLGLDGHLQTGGFWAFHPALAPLTPLWLRGEFGAVQAVSTPYRDKRSHFDGQDILEAGLPGLEDGRVRDGWLNRMMQIVPGMTSETAYAIGTDQLLILDGSADVARWAPEARLRIGPQAERLIDLVTHSDPLFRDATADAIEIAQSIDEQGEMGMESVGNGGHVRAATFAAERLLGETRIASFSLGGWDTHGRQRQGLARALGNLSDVILTLEAGLGPVWEKTAVLCLTEFGRTVAENGTRGTDHGTGGALLYAGGALKGGQVLGDWPGLDQLYAGRDLLPTRDLRAHAGWTIRSLFGLDADLIETRVFPGVELGPRSGLLL
ncbi:DUF1501 domain-containing protein [Ponticoccus sp. SC2-23]|uniref:DUF1501 domain-containing protein n=1 Tax=Alexandriicola marinus TaxID=2081710 RepID=UPI000FD86079|nr:DUF1501 domain-containing protein [Alexandriicola marinus]MBM1220033.1 DUF1501 domain-containing protein [Ponticoccus sp. SC6-9]MBM1224719.1 DUF1501 domain-containing protein [Ponticoccus sp. SC6-15]MBM1228232.1 DUF1501 domain-containing protein [Ponticoccus sp. SC6-38]MBM1234130.1 DUF1501 domain-containing protein [Ponticoccus sp. SC6-45]MBM1238734.1 DUF1501 domain-containing protein [Ponticoccus sp. SC6-49]MBM1242515.1 DUF1501 domain-containing protein [Ponticoccus sp. SC2-64]MBM1247654